MPVVDTPEQAAIRAKADRLFAELAAIRPILDNADQIKKRRLEVWVELRDLAATQKELEEHLRIRITHAQMAEASGCSSVAVTLALGRHTKAELESRKAKTDG